MTMIGVLDCNNFFVSCERLFRPDLINKPVVVLSGNDGCVLARSQEVKDMGIPMGVPYFQIKDIIKKEKVIVFFSNPILYRDISRRVFDVVEREVGFIEEYSVDECFFIVNQDKADEIAFKLKKQVEKEVGIPVTIGVAYSRTQAKYVNRVAKRTDGVAVWRNKQWQECSETIKLADIWGVGANRSRQFSDKKLVTVKDFCDLSPSTLRRLFGIEGLRLRSEFLGESVLNIESKRSSQKSVMSTRSFSKKTFDIGVLEDAIAHHVHKTVYTLEKNNLLATSLRIMIKPGRYSDFSLQGASLETKFVSPTKDLFIIRKEAGKLLDSCYKSGVPYKKAGVVLSGLVDADVTTKSLFSSFSNSSESSTSTLSSVVFDINNKHRNNSLIRLGCTSNLKSKWRNGTKSLSPAYTTSWNELKIVSA